MAAQDLFIGCVRELQNTQPGAWGFPELAQLLRRPAAVMCEGMRHHYPRGAALVANADSQTTASVLSTLGGFTRLIDDLATAWPKVGKRRFSMTEWIRDDYIGRKQIIVQSGPDPTLTKAYIAAMIDAEQGPDIDCISGATITTAGVRQATTDALIQAGADLQPVEVGGGTTIDKVQKGE